MNILFVNSSRIWGGNEKWTLRAAEVLASRGHGVCMTIREPAVWQGHAAGSVEQIVLPFRNDADLGTVFALRKLIRRRRIEVLAPTRSRDYWLSGFANLGRPAVYVMRMGITRTLPDTIKERLRYGRFPDGIVVNAEAVRESLIRHSWVKPDRVRVIYNGVDTKEPVEFPESLKREGEFLIIAAGRVESDKGFDVLIDALAVARRDVPDLKAVIFGQGDQVPVLQEQIERLGLQDTVRLGGFTTNLAGALRQADLAVSSSHREGISNFLLESWAAGAPVIATSIPGSAEVLQGGKRGGLVPPGNSGELAAAIVRAARDPDLRQRWTDAGREALRTTFNWTHMAEELEKFFQELILK